MYRNGGVRTYDIFEVKTLRLCWRRSGQCGQKDAKVRKAIGLAFIILEMEPHTRVSE